MKRNLVLGHRRLLINPARATLAQRSRTQLSAPLAPFITAIWTISRLAAFRPPLAGRDRLATGG
jgi:hypothetical protein